MRTVMRLAMSTALPLGLVTAVPAGTAFADPANCGRITHDWEAVDLPSFSRAYGVNELGHIAGSKVTNPGQVPPRHVAVVWKDGKVTELGHLFGAQLRGAHSVANDIDDKGRVAGFSTHLDGKRHAFLWDGWLRDLGSWGVDSEGHAIGNGRVGGFTARDDAAGDVLKKRRPTYWDNGEFQTSGVSGAEIVDVNGTGGLTGNENLSFATDVGAPGPERAVRAFARIGQDFRLLGTLGGNWSSASGINDHGQVVGQSATGQDGYEQDGFIWDTQYGMRRLPDHDTGNAAKPAAINDQGLIAGDYACHLGEGPAVWPTPTSDPYLLPLPTGAVDAFAEDVNNRGDIVGTAQYTGGVTRAVLWRKKG